MAKTNKKSKDVNRDDYLSFKQLFKLYTKFKIPWVYLILTGVMTILMQQATLWLVPYTTKMQQGAITAGGFVLGYVLMHLLSGVVEILQESILDLASTSTARNVRRSVWNKILRLPINYFSRGNSQEIVSRVTKDTESIYAGIAIIITIISTVYGTVASFERMYRIYKSLSLIMLCGIPVMLFFAWIIGKLQFRYIYIQNSAMARMTSFFAERLSNLFHIKTSNMEDEEYARGIEENNLRYKAECRAERRFIFMAPLGSMAMIIFEIVLFVVASGMVRAGQMKMFQMLSLYNYYILFMSNAYMIIGVWQSVKTAHGASTTLGKLMDADEEDITSGDALPENLTDICFEHVSFSYDGVKPVLKDVSFVIPKGKKTVIVGENGSGKSTIIRLIERFETQTAGTIRFGEKSLDDLNLTDLREKVGFLFQGNQIVQGSIEDNILYGVNRECTREEMLEAARLAKAYDFILDKEEGFDTKISHTDTKCSGGEMQRIAVARMILKKPDYLIMDEATSGIDVVSARAVMESIDEMMAGKTVIMVSHDMDTIKTADHIIVLNEGVIEASGSYDEVMENSELFRQFAVV